MLRKIKQKFLSFFEGYFVEILKKQEESNNQQLKIYAQQLEIYTQQLEILNNQQQIFNKLELLKNSDEWLQKSINNTFDHIITLDGCINTVYNLTSTVRDNVDFYYKHPNPETISNTQYSNLEYLSSLLTDKSDKKILLAGFYGAYNLGDELMLQTLLSYIPEEYHRSITVLLYRGDNYNNLTFPTVNFLHYPKTTFDYDFLAKEFDVLVWGGGALLDDTYYNLGHTNLLGNMIVDMSERFIAFKKSVIGIGLSASEKLFNEKYINKLVKIAPSFDYFSVRDNHSFKLLKSLGVENIIERNDIVFGDKFWSTYKPVPENDVVETVGVTLVCQKETKALFKKLIAIIDNKFGTQCKIKCIPFFNCDENDLRFYEEFKQEFDKNDRIIVCEYKNTISEVCAQIASIDVMVNMRYHAMLLTSMLGKKSLNICYDISPHYYNKVRHLMEQFNTMENMVHYDAFLDNSFDIGILKKPTEHKDLYENTANEIKNVCKKYMR